MSKRKNRRREADVIASRGGKKLHKKRKRLRLDVPPRVVYAFGITAAVVVVVILSFTMFFNVRQADIKGCELYTYDQVLIMSGISNNTNLLRMNTDTIEKRLVEGLPYIQEAKVTKRFPDSIDIVLTEAAQKANLDNDGRYMVISAEGIVLETDRKSAVSGLPIIYGFEPEDDTAPGTEMVSKDNLKAKIVKTLLSSIDKLGLDKVSEIDITDRTDIILKYDGRLDIYIGSSYDMEYKLEQIKAVIDKGLTDSFKGVLRYNGTDSGISAIPESSAKTRADVKAARDEAKKKKAEAEQAAQQSEAQGEQQTETPEGDEQEPSVPAATTEAPVVTTAPPETEPLPPSTTTWAGW